jgi:hypothetical protein
VSLSPEYLLSEIPYRKNKLYDLNFGSILKALCFVSRTYYIKPIRAFQCPYVEPFATLDDYQTPFAISGRECLIRYKSIPTSDL